MLVATTPEDWRGIGMAEVGDVTAGDPSAQCRHRKAFRKKSQRGECWFAK